jgi:tRNA threonylcarbamoyl adenosine modification protein (Sua5/YciO/YrdC/YwlC family)
MAQYFEIHPDNPQARLIRQAIDIIHKGGVIVYPTDSSYAIGCHIGDKRASDAIRRIRQLDNRHDFTLVCSDLSQVSTFSKIANNHHRLIKTLTPGAFTFILDATREVPKRLQHPKKKTIGIRIPDHSIVQALLKELDEPLLSSTLILPEQTRPLFDPYEIRAQLEHELALVIDGGIIDDEPTTVINLVGDQAEITRQGKGLAPMLN